LLVILAKPGTQPEVGVCAQRRKPGSRIESLAGSRNVNRIMKLLIFCKNYTELYNYDQLSIINRLSL